MPVLISGLQNRVKNSAAYAEDLGLMLVANGEEMPYLLTSQGEKIPAGIAVPTVIPTVTDTGSGNLTHNNWAVYVYVYVNENGFPLVAPRLYSNPSPHSLAFQYTASGDRKVNVTITGTDDVLVDKVYLYRTTLQTTQILAETAADAGLLYFIGSIDNPGVTTATIEDNLLTNLGNPQVDFTNFVTSQFRFVVWDGSYFWGFANHPFRAEASWETDGTIILANPSVDKFFGGRNEQFITFSTISTGGIDNRGTFLFKQTGDFSGQAILEDGSDATLPSNTGGNIVIVGPTANLYRSGYRNPFQWGYMQSIAGTFIPALWELKVSGALGTAIAIIPDQQLLKLDMEFPALCLTFALQTASTDVFAATKRQVSRLYSVTSHFSQFTAISKGRQVLWGMDFKNLAIVECDGFTQVPISSSVSVLLRNLTKNRSLHLLTHGTYDPVTEINALWLSSSSVDAGLSPTTFDLCIYQHAPTGYWGMFADYGILCSAPVEDPITSARNTLVGTENGFLGKAFDITTNGNWLPLNSPIEGFIRAATANTFTRSEGQDDFNPTDGGLIGNYVIVVDPTGLIAEICNITNATFDTITVAQTLNPIPTTTDDPGLVDGQWKFFIGLIELRMVKYFDDGSPSVDKAPREFWATLSDAKSPIVQFYHEHAIVPIKSIALKQDAELDAWFQKFDFPTVKGKTYGLALVERSFNPTKFFNFTLK